MCFQGIALGLGLRMWDKDAGFRVSGWEFVVMAQGLVLWVLGTKLGVQNISKKSW
jgi:hypothetical protein